MKPPLVIHDVVKILVDASYTFKNVSSHKNGLLWNDIARKQVRPRKIFAIVPSKYLTLLVDQVTITIDHVPVWVLKQLLRGIGYGIPFKVVI